LPAFSRSLLCSLRVASMQSMLAICGLRGYRHGEAARHVARGQKITGIFACYFFALLSLLQNYESMDFKFWNLIHWIIKF
jgi:hypothetical protein